MTDPAADRAARRRAEILAVAREEFSRRGFAGARIRDISATTGVTDAMIYRLFPSKQVLFEEAIADSLAGLVERMREMAAEFEGASRAKRYGLAQATQAEVLRLFEEIAPLLGVALFHDSEAGRHFYRDLLWPALAECADALSGVLTEKQKRVIDPQQLILAMMGMHLAAATARTQDPDGSRVAGTAVGDAITESLAYGLSGALLK